MSMEFKGYDEWKLDCGPWTESESFAVTFEVILTHEDGTETPISDSVNLSEAVHEELFDMSDAERAEWLVAECHVIYGDGENFRVTKFILERY